MIGVHSAGSFLRRFFVKSRFVKFRFAGLDVSRASQGPASLLRDNAPLSVSESPDWLVFPLGSSSGMATASSEDV